jgi:hypothetical protein
MNKLLLIILLLSTVACSTDAPKYRLRDCITPTNDSYSWYGEYAIVEAFGKIGGYSRGKKYILRFPDYASNSSIFSKEIESQTKKAGVINCKDKQEK